MAGQSLETLSRYLDSILVRSVQALSRDDIPSRRRGLIVNYRPRLENLLEMMAWPEVAWAGRGRASKLECGGLWILFSSDRPATTSFDRVRARPGVEDESTGFTAVARKVGRKLDP